MIFYRNKFSRHNNRKNTRGRHTQFINCVDDDGKQYVKCIKHVGK